MLPVLFLALLQGCVPGEEDPVPVPAAREAETPAKAGAGGPAVLFVGTSLTAGYGLDPEEAFPARIQEKIDSAGLPHRVVNAGVSGETSAGALNRVDWLLRQPFEVFVLETGANDMLRGVDPGTTRANIDAILRRVREERPGAELVLLEIWALPNLGPRYGERFRAIYTDLAEEHEAMLVPFFLEGVAGEPALNLEDGIHPNAEGQRRVAENVWPVLREVLE